ncbi:MAG: hypothetical protein LBK60_02205 [Verrucomicrobiales bacterium]|jgi:hypothetical protein|nr:hypothetical protein [Verrucomicrobiales bacterium]
MKTRLMLFVALLPLTVMSLRAQDFQTTQKPAGPTPAKSSTERPAPGEPLPPRATGVVIMMSERGLQVINPLAPKDAGDGRKNVTASHVLNPAPAAQEDPKPCGGVNIIGWEF